MKSCTIMMVTYNRLDLTKKMLESLWKSADYPFNLVIVDNGSTDGTVEYLRDTFNPDLTHDEWPFGDCVQIPYIHLNGENLGIAKGRNLALKLAVDKFNSDWLCTVDNDVEMPFGWLKESISIMENCPSFAAIGVNMEDKPYPLVTLNNKVFQEKPFGNLGTACMVFNKKIQKLLGYFNIEYGPYGEEDADFGVRMRVLNYKMGYVEKMGIHLGSGDNDVGEYRAFKDECRSKNSVKFRENCRLYASKRKSYYLPYKV